MHTFRHNCTFRFFTAYCITLGSPVFQACNNQTFPLISTILANTQFDRYDAIRLVITATSACENTCATLLESPTQPLHPVMPGPEERNRDDSHAPVAQRRIARCRITRHIALCCNTRRHAHHAHGMPRSHSMRCRMPLRCHLAHCRTSRDDPRSRVWSPAAYRGHVRVPQGNGHVHFPGSPLRSHGPCRS